MITIIKIIFCHVIGDYLFQSDYIADNKGKSWYILFVHCVLYGVPFVITFGVDWRVVLLMAIHFPVDALKARWHKTTLLEDQIIHYITAIILYLI